MNEHDQIRNDVQTALKIATESCGEKPPAEIVAAILNAVTAQRLSGNIDETAQRLANQIYQSR